MNAISSALRNLCMLLKFIPEDDRANLARTVRENCPEELLQLVRDLVGPAPSTSAPRPVKVTVVESK